MIPAPRVSHAKLARANCGQSSFLAEAAQAKTKELVPHRPEFPVLAPKSCSIIGHVNEMHEVARVRSIG